MIFLRWLLFLACFHFLFSSCDLLRDSPYKVEAWTPGEGYHNDPGKIKVSILLSHESDKAETEQAFSLMEDRKTLKGNFHWESSRLIFIPASPLELNRNYTVSLRTGARDSRGQSLERPFEASFTTCVPGVAKPAVVRTEPVHEGILSGSWGEFRLFFSEPIHLNSMDHVSFDPPVSGAWRLEDENRTACLIPRDPWQAGIQYKVKVKSGFAAASGTRQEDEFSSVFTLGTDNEKPVLLKVLALLPDGTEEEINVNRSGVSPDEGYTTWESNTRLVLDFSEPVNLNGLKSLLVIEPGLALVMESPPEYSSQAVFRLAVYPAWGSSFLFRLNTGVKDQAGNESDEEYSFRISCGGSLSKPPSFEGIRLPMAPDKIGDQEIVSYTPWDLFAYLPVRSDDDCYPFSEKIDTWIELYFNTAPDTEIDIFSVMDLFRVDHTNNALTFSPVSIRTENFSWPSPKEGWENFQRIEIRGVLTNTVYSGIVTFRISPGLRDKRGNKSTVDFRISLLK